MKVPAITRSHGTQADELAPMYCLGALSMRTLRSIIDISPYPRREVLRTVTGLKPECHETYQSTGTAM